MGQSMDVGTHDVLIEKLEMGLQTNSDIEIKLRLADLYADRSRLKTIKENEEQCVQCHSSNKDRSQSLSLYQDLFDKVSDDDKKRVFEQISQSYILLSQNKKALDFYNKIIDKKYSRSLKAMAYQKRGDHFFFAHSYDKAFKDYKSSIKLDSTLKTPLISYRMAWCEFNSGQYMLAKNHLNQILSSSNDIDSSLRSDIARDYAKFTAKGPIDNTEIKKVHQLSATQDGKLNVELLATELDRLGRPVENIVVNHYLLEAFETDPADKALAYMRMAQAELSLKRYNSVTQSFNKSTDFYRKINCDKFKERCDEYQSKAQKFLVFWNRVEKDKPSRQLHEVWVSYLSLYPADFDMHFVAAQSFHKGKKISLAQEHYLKTAELVYKDEKPESRKLLEVSLDAAMACAEESNITNQKRTAYKSYLKFNPKGKKQLQAKYQLAYIDYQEKIYPDASRGFENVIKEQQDHKLQNELGTALKSAHLILDIHALSKNNVKIMEDSQKFSNTFKKNQNEFQAIYRKALLNESLASLKAKPSDLKWQDQLMQKLKSINLAQVQTEEKVLLLETRIRLAQSIKNLDEVKNSSLALMGIKNLKINIKNFAYDQYIWASEMALDFKKAYEFSLIRFEKNRRGKNEQIRLAVLSEMGGKNSRPHYEEALQKTRGTLESNQLRAKIVQNSSSPWAEISKQHKYLKSSPQLFSELALDTYARYPNRQKAEMVLSEKNVASKPAGIRLRRHLEISKFKNLTSRVSKHIISHRSESRAQKDIVTRMQLLGELEKFANASIERKDLVLQTVSLEAVKKEKLRLARDLITLPLPKGLSKKDQIQYLKILEGQVAKIETEAKMIGQKIETVWKSGTLMTHLNKSLEGSSFNLKKLIAQEANLILPYAPESQKNQLSKWMNVQGPDQKSLLAARNKLRSNPFDESSLRALIDQEKSHDHFTHVAYHEQRLMDLQKRITP